MRWHQMNIDEVFEELDSSPMGLSCDVARKRLQKYGPNELTEKPKRPLFMMFLDQFRDFMIVALIVAAVISGFIGDVSDTVAIVIIVVLNGVIGFTQEFRAGKAMAMLRKMAARRAVAIRGGGPADIPAAQLVPGDVVLLESGEIAPADMRLIETARLKIDEAPLTGESLPVEKQTTPLPEESLPIADRKNMVYKGTTVCYGRGKGMVIATGMSTELGKIAGMLQEEEETKTPLQKRLAVFGKNLAMAVLAICAIVFSLGVLRGEPPMLMLLTAVSLAVAAIPEALPAVVTISLALGAKKMVRQNALVRKLPAVETLGSATYICTDKTGTLTLNKMTVDKVYVNGEILQVSDFSIPNSYLSDTRSPPSILMTALAMSNDTVVDATGRVIGEPTEIALYNVAKQTGFDKNELRHNLPRVAEIPFDSDRKLMTTFHQLLGAEVMDQESGRKVRYVSFTKGAIDLLVDKSVNILTAEGLKTIDSANIQRVNETMSADGLRVIGIAMRSWETLPEVTSPEQVETGLTILGIVAMMDPPREEAKEAVRLCKSAGIKPVMITGDHPFTAIAIAKRLGILEQDSGAVITGVELERLSLEEFEERVEMIRVYARVAPEQKLKIVRALQDKGEFVAMTGDGVNDAPALKRADIGIAMGITGADVSKESSHMILLDDNFSTIVKAVKEGRQIFDNIRKFIKYIMTGNTGEIWTIFLAPIMGLPIPLLPIHILWINLVTDGLPGLAMAAEPAEKGIMERPPRHPRESIFAHGLGVHVIWVGLLMGAVSLLTQSWALKTGHAHWQTMVFTVLCMSQLGHALAIRSERESLFSQGILSNKPLVGAFLLTFLLQMATIYTPQLNPIFKTVPLSPHELLISLALSSVVFIAVEIEKLVKRRLVLSSCITQKCQHQSN